MLKRSACVLLLSCCFSFPAFAYDKERVAENLKDDYGHCVLYYRYAIKSAPDNASAAEFKQLQDATDSALEAYMMFTTGETTKQIEAHLDGYNLAMSKIFKQKGLDGLSVRYSDLCKNILEHPEDRIKYWTDRK